MSPPTTETSSQTSSLAGQLPPIILGGAGFSYQQHSSPASLPVTAIIKRAFDLGVCCMDTSPYYEPSESLIGEALTSSSIQETYKRSDYILMTKVGRVGVDAFDYSATWIRQSVARSLQRLRTSYLDVVFVHDIEFMPLLSTLTAISTLIQITDEKPGIIRNIGISGYSLPSLVRVARLARDHLPRPLDVVQVWAQLTLQNSTLAANPQNGIIALRDAGVKCVCSSSPLAAGLLRESGVPVGALGDWHPAPAGLRDACFMASQWVQKNSEEVAGRKEELASLALQYSVVKAKRVEREAGRGQIAVRTIVGASSIEDLESNVKAVQKILKPMNKGKKGTLAVIDALDEDVEDLVSPLFEGVQRILGPWLDFDFGSQKKSGVDGAVDFTDDEAPSRAPDRSLDVAQGRKQQ